jgi:hypothetical protein
MQRSIKGNPDWSLPETKWRRVRHPFESGKASRKDRYTTRSRTSIRRHPKRRASTDHAPGPSNANAAPMVARKIQADGSPDRETAYQSARAPARDPAMGVHSPAIREIPAATATTCKIADSRVAPANNRVTPLPAKAIPATNRINRRPAPGEPPAKVENRRRTRFFLYDL